MSARDEVLLIGGPHDGNLYPVAIEHDLFTLAIAPDPREWWQDAEEDPFRPARHRVATYRLDHRLHSTRGHRVFVHLRTEDR